MVGGTGGAQLACWGLHYCAPLSVRSEFWQEDCMRPLCLVERGSSQEAILGLVDPTPQEPLKAEAAHPALA